LQVHVYHVPDFVGEPCESEEMAPVWFSYADIPYGTYYHQAYFTPLWQILFCIADCIILWNVLDTGCCAHKVPVRNLGEPKFLNGQ
jgi:hypothetical protein